MENLQRCHGISRGNSFELEAPPSPFFVKTVGPELKQLGADSSYEGRTVDGKSVRYLSTSDMSKFMQNVQVPCEIVFAQTKEDKCLADLRCREREDNGETGAMIALGLSVISIPCIL